MNKREEQAKEHFDDFLMVMDDQLDALADEAFKRGITLDFSLDDCEQLEHLFDAMSAEIDEDTKSSLVVTFARHLGEIVRLRFGGKWHLPLDDENNVYFNTPVLVGHSTMKDLEFAPTFVMRGYALRKKAGSLRRAIDADINIKPLDLSHLPDE